MLRAFGLYFQLANLAEQHHRLRRRREDARHGSVRARVARRRVRPPRATPTCERAPAATSIRLVLTAHPTEATRRTVLLAHIRIAEELYRLDDERLPPAERPRSRSGLAEEVTLLWQTDEVRHDRLRITDEIRHGLWFFEHSLMDAAADLLAEWRERLPGAPPPLRFGSWIGGDIDGNPAAGPASIKEALARARALALGRYREEVRALAVKLAIARARSSRSAPSSRHRSSATSASFPVRGARSARETSSSRTGASSRSCGGGSATTATRRRTSCSTTCA